MRKISKRKYLILISLVILIMSLLPLTTGCSPEGRELAIAFLKEWAAEKKIDPSTPEGIWNIGIRTLGGSTGDEDADAAIDAGLVVKNLVEADKLAEEGYKEGDVKKIDKAITMRPKDWTYKASKANLLLKQGDFDGWGDEMANADEIVKKENNSNTKVALYTKNIKQIEEVREELDWKGYTGIRQQYVVHNELFLNYSYRSHITGSAADKAKVESYGKIASELKDKL
ncbi:hypothetical protein ACFLTP_09810 [Chloroflexota bacterium]